MVLKGNSNMLTFFTDPYPDELLYSACSRYHYYSGNQNIEDTGEKLFGKRSAVASFEIGNHLHFLCDELGGLYNMKYLLQKHTIFPFYSPFLPNKRRNGIVENSSSGNSSAIYFKLGFNTGISKKTHIYYCTSCSGNDFERYGEAYIHREHQLQGVLVCPHHGQVLRRYPIRISGRGRLQYIRLEKGNLELSNSSNPLWYSKYQNNLLDISKAAYYLLCNDLSDVNEAEILQRYKNLLYKMNLTFYNFRIKQRELHDMLVSHYGNELLNILGSDIKNNCERSWLRNATTNLPRSVHPIRHILLILFLCGDMKSFFKNLKQEYNPFGKGPWPCLNKASDHYQQNVIEHSVVGMNKKKQKPIGTFACKCGYVYSRTGPDNVEEDRYRKNGIKSFGPVWENKLKKLLNEGCHSFYMIGHLLGCSSITVKKYATRLIKENSIRIYTVKNKKIPTDSLLNEYRDRLLSAIKENPEITRTDIAMKYAMEWKFLCRYNKEEFLKILPPKGKRGRKRGCNISLDWDKRDRELVLQLQEAYIEILNRRRPIRITQSALSRKIYQFSLLNGNNLKKLPQCAQFIKRVSESKEQFQLRRCQISITRMKKEGITITPWRIKHMAGVNNEEYARLKEKISQIASAN